MVTSQEATRRLLSEIGPEWPRCKPVPTELIVALCEALWREGGSPTVARLASHLDLSVRAVRPGVLAWRRRVDTSTFEVQTPASQQRNLDYLIRIVSPAIATAPRTCLDPLHPGRWPVPGGKILAYLARIRDPSLRNTLTLLALIDVGIPETSVYGCITGFASGMQRLMLQTSMPDVTSVDPYDLFARLYRREIGHGFTDHHRVQMLKRWNHVSHSFGEYAAKLSAEDVNRMAPFFIRPVADRRKLRQWSLLKSVIETQRERVKAKTDVIYSRFHEIRHVASLRLNQAMRLKQATDEAIRHVTTQGVALPHRFSYDETATTRGGRRVKQRVHLCLWDTKSIFDLVWTLWPARDSTSKRARGRRETRTSPENHAYEVQFLGVEGLEPGIDAEPFWFAEFYENSMFTTSTDPEVRETQRAFNRKWGYKLSQAWPANGLTGSASSPNARDLFWLLRNHGMVFLPVIGILATCFFGNLLVEVQTKTGARLGEVQQIAQNPECIKQLVNVGPKATTRWLLRMIPKGRKQRADYFIDNKTKDLLMEVIGFLRECCGSKKLPIVPFEPQKVRPDRYIFQWKQRSLAQNILNDALRFLLHGCITASDGSGIHLTSHYLRHAFATEMASLNVPIEVLAALLHQRDPTVTRYYAQPTRTQVMNAADMIFVDRIDVAAEALRKPDEVGRMLREAEGKIGALTEVIGGTCVISNFCPAKFACIGCAGNAPDPDKRYQIERKKAWAEQQEQWAIRERLPAEQRQMKQLQADCDLMLKEMDLIEIARADRRQAITVNHGGCHDKNEQ
jgi:hypothetical protein